MLRTSRMKGIIFDMDNTLLQSNINFPDMKKEVFDYLVRQHFLPEDFPVQEHTTSTLIECAKKTGITDDIYASIMKITEKHEVKGMEGAGLEPGVKELLECLYQNYVLVIITNNSCSAALTALQKTKIHHYFDLIIGREQMSALKPSPSGYHYAQSQFKQISSDEWIAVGDSWIDGRAAMDAGIPFIGYKSNEEDMAKKGIEAIGRITSMKEIMGFIS